MRQPALHCYVICVSSSCKQEKGSREAARASRAPRAVGGQLVHEHLALTPGETRLLGRALVRSLALGPRGKARGAVASLRLELWNMVAPSVPLCVAALLALSFISLRLFAHEWGARAKAKASHLATGPLHSDALPSLPRRAQVRPEWPELASQSRKPRGSRQLECGELRRVREAALLGLGYTKAVFGAALRDGLSVALKRVNERGADMETCLRELGDASACYELVSCKLSREIVLLQRLQHRNIIQLYGHCQPGEQGGGVMSALEQGSPLQMIQLLQTPWEERFRVCLGLVRLLDYLSKSPLGSVVLLDFQPRQFVLVSGELKLTDLDDAGVGDPVCNTDADCVLYFPLRNFSIACSSEGICEGLNEKRNLYNSYRYFFTYLLPHRAPPALQYLIEQIMNTTGELKGGVNDTLEAFEELLHLYKSGLYLENLPSSIIKDYTVAEGMKAAGGRAYRCWPSYDHSGCVLSVHDAHEAALLCHSHRECAGFTLGSQRTWTGRILASFRSAFDDLVPDVNSVVYVKKAGASDPAL